MFDRISDLFGMAGKKDRQIEKHLDRLAEVVDAHPDPDLTAELVQEIRSELRHVRGWRGVAFGAAILLTIVAILSGLWMKFREDTESTLVEALREQQLPVRFETTADGSLGIKPDASGLSGTPAEKVSGLLESLGYIGRHPAMGSEKEVALRRVAHSGGYPVYQVEPSPGDSAQAVGRLTLLREEGSFNEPYRYVLAGGTRSHSGMPDFWFRLVDYVPIGDAGQWRILFGEGLEAEVKWHSDTVFVKRSPDGSEREHVVLTDPEWRGIYFVSVGAGAPGADTANASLRNAWNVNSRVTRFSPLR